MDERSSLMSWGMGLWWVYDTPARMSASWMEGAMKMFSVGTSSWVGSCESGSSISFARGLVWFWFAGVWG